MKTKDDAKSFRMCGGNLIAFQTIFLLQIFPEKSAGRAGKSHTYITCIVLSLFQQNWRNVSVAKLIQFPHRTLTFFNSVMVGEVKLDIKVKVASL